MENTLILFVAHMHNDRFAPGTMKSYLEQQLGVGKISMNQGDPHISQMPQLEFVLTGAKHRVPAGNRKDYQLPQGYCDI